MQIQGRSFKTEDLKYRYIVRGWGYFPTDMLRYDRCLCVWAEIVEPERHHPIIEWTILGASPPTTGRWESFMYNIVGRVEKI